MNIFIFFLITFSALQLFAHGEDKPGPHGGMIKMAKTIHTEVASDKDGSFHIFLLDINFSNPTVKNSTLSGSIASSQGDFKLDCSVMEGTHYHCKTKNVRPKIGKLNLKANRDGVSVDVSYDLKALDGGMKETNAVHTH